MHHDLLKKKFIIIYLFVWLTFLVLSNICQNHCQMKSKKFIMDKKQSLIYTLTCSKKSFITICLFVWSMTFSVLSNYFPPNCLESTNENPSIFFLLLRERDSCHLKSTSLTKEPITHFIQKNNINQLSQNNCF